MWKLIWKLTINQQSESIR